MSFMSWLKNLFKKEKKRNIERIIIHYSASDRPEHDDISVIREWHLSRGWRDVGYHYFIKKDGTLQNGRPEYMIGAHCKSYNRASIGICLSGKDDLQDAQFKTVAKLIDKLKNKYNLKDHDLFLHKQLGNTECPGMNPKEFREKIDSY